jgi:hypothetical protein
MTETKTPTTENGMDFTFFGAVDCAWGLELGICFVLRASDFGFRVLDFAWNA